MTVEASSGYGSPTSHDCLGEEDLGSSRLSLLMFASLFSKPGESLPQWLPPRALLFSPATACGTSWVRAPDVGVVLALAWMHVSEASSLRGGINSRAFDSQPHPQPHSLSFLLLPLLPLVLGFLQSFPEISSLREEALFCPCRISGLQHCYKDPVSLTSSQNFWPTDNNFPASQLGFWFHITF